MSAARRSKQRSAPKGTGSEKKGDQPPLPNSYWVLPGQLLAGEYPAAVDLEAARERIGCLLRAGIDCFVNLTMPDEVAPYADLLPAGVRYHEHPIQDHGLPEQPEQMRELLGRIDSALRAGRRVYVHCRAGIGRTGTVIGCLLVERGRSGDAALEELNRVWQKCARARTWQQVPETEDQVGYVRQWEPPPAPSAPAEVVTAAETPLAVEVAVVEVSVPAAAPGADSLVDGAALGALGTVRERFLGALVGLATGDALAAATQHRRPGTFKPVADLLGGGAYEVPRGAWTDDTAMALCLADSLTACKGFDARDQVARYTRWQQQGYLSATGQCIGITASTARALAAGNWRRQAFPGSHDPKQRDPEPLARLAPAVMYCLASVDQAVRLAGDTARITCQSPVVVEACRVFAAMLHAALSGLSKEEVLAPPRGLTELRGIGLRPRIRSLLRGRYRGKKPDQVRAQGGILEILEAVLWAFERSRDFREGALLAVNLGENSDLVGAAYGQLAGAYYGVEAIPPKWRNSLMRLDVIESLADELLTQALVGMSETPS
ncbi:MAG TPA: ADP-ribosylglycohydrolase family protein [Steroidobacteraceae bacterium]|nr:ADP-ribosylglycohydrolase family protein [Steroidobacteraceae bacterium]